LNKVDRLLEYVNNGADIRRQLTLLIGRKDADNIVARIADDGSLEISDPIPYESLITFCDWLNTIVDEEF